MPTFAGARKVEPFMGSASFTSGGMFVGGGEALIVTFTAAETPEAPPSSDAFADKANIPVGALLQVRKNAREPGIKTPPGAGGSTTTELVTTPRPRSLAKNSILVTTRAKSPPNANKLMSDGE